MKFEENCWDMVPIAGCSYHSSCCLFHPLKPIYEYSWESTWRRVAVVKTGNDYRAWTMMTVVFISSTLRMLLMLRRLKKEERQTVDMRLHSQMFSNKVASWGRWSDVVDTNNDIADVGERSHCRCLSLVFYLWPIEEWLFSLLQTHMTRSADRRRHPAVI